MAEQLDNIVSRYKNLWVDIKNKKLEKLPVIKSTEINKEAVKILNNKGLGGGKSKNPQAVFLDTVHKLTDQLHYIRAIEDAQL